MCPSKYMMCLLLLCMLFVKTRLYLAVTDTVSLLDLRVLNSLIWVFIVTGLDVLYSIPDIMCDCTYSMYVLCVVHDLHTVQIVGTLPYFCFLFEIYQQNIYRIFKVTHLSHTTYHTSAALI